MGGDAALYVEDQHDVDGLTELIVRVRDDADLRVRLAAEGRRQAARFSWDRCAQETAAVLREALTG